MDERQISDQLETVSRLVRVEEKINQLEKLVQDQKQSSSNSIAELKSMLEKFVGQQSALLSQNTTQINVIEKRVDKLYTIGSIAVFVIGPIISIIAKSLLGKFGF